MNNTIDTLETVVQVWLGEITKIDKTAGFVEIKHTDIYTNKDLETYKEDYETFIKTSELEPFIEGIKFHLIMTYDDQHGCQGYTRKIRDTSPKNVEQKNIYWLSQIGKEYINK